MRALVFILSINQHRDPEREKEKIKKREREREREAREVTAEPAGSPSAYNGWLRVLMHGRLYSAPNNVITTQRFPRRLRRSLIDRQNRPSISASSFKLSIPAMKPGVN